MCESNAYFVDKDGTEKLIMESVDYIKPEADSVTLRSIFGEERTVRGRLKELKLTGHRILLADAEGVLP